MLVSNVLKISGSVVKQLVNLYEVSELEEMLKTAMAAVLAGEQRITSTSSGTGVSVSLTDGLSPAELVELLTLALDFADGKPLAAPGAAVVKTINTNPFADRNL